MVRYLVKNPVCPPCAVMLQPTRSDPPPRPARGLPHRGLRDWERPADERGRAPFPVAERAAEVRQGRDAVVRLSGRAAGDAEAEALEKAGRHQAEPGKESRPSAEEELVKPKWMLNTEHKVTNEH